MNLSKTLQRHKDLFKATKEKLNFTVEPLGFKKTVINPSALSNITSFPKKIDLPRSLSVSLGSTPKLAAVRYPQIQKEEASSSTKYNYNDNLIETDFNRRKYSRSMVEAML